MLGCVRYLVPLDLGGVEGVISRVMPALVRSISWLLDLQ